jgi:selenocysteine-specific elongation factor
VHVVATAGHVDHGKSTLVRALTGMEPDRWAEERQRGMTIDLGYAWTTLDDGTQLAFVDVPGHQRFITNMLAGIGPVPAVLLVVAADEGWARQTGEHLAALEALGVRHGVLAVTRSDLGDAELAIEEARDYLAGTALEHIEAVPVSPVAGTGLDELRAALARLVGAVEAPTSRATRLWVDRVFTVRGAGTVVTGTLASGAVRVGDELLVSPTGERVTVRAVESLKAAVPAVSAVARVALNLRGVKKGTIHRGDALITPERWAQSSVLDVRLLRASAKLPEQPILHIGSAALTVRLRPLGPDTARLTLTAPLPLHVGERGILRDPGREEVVAGIVVLDTDPPSLRRRGAAARRAEQLEGVSGAADPDGEVRRRGAVRRSQLIAAGVLEPDDQQPAEAVAVGDWLLDAGRWAQWQAELRAAADRWAAEHPLAPGMPGGAAVQQLDLPDPALLDPLVRDVAELVLDGDGVHRHDVSADLPPAVETALTDLEQHLRAHPFAAKERPELDAVGLTEKHLATATKIGRLLRVAPGIYLLPEAADEASRLLAELPQPFTLSQARQALDTTRRVAVPLLELLDRQHRTVRVESQLRTVRG